MVDINKQAYAEIVLSVIGMQMVIGLGSAQKQASSFFRYLVRKIEHLDGA